MNRLLKTLAHLGLTERTAQRKYRPGPGIHVLAAQALYGSGLLRRAAVHLEELNRFGLIVAMGVLWRDHVCYLYHAMPGMSVAEALGRVELFPAMRSGIGVALLARDADLRRFGGDERATLKTARERGYALVEQEHGRSLGVALGGNDQAAIALSGVISDSQASTLAAALRATADAISHMRLCDDS